MVLGLWGAERNGKERRLACYLPSAVWLRRSRELTTDNRVRADETPYYGTDAAKATTLGSPQNYTSRFSSRHSAGGNMAFSDGHAAFFKYAYVCVANNGKPCDPAKPDINWSHDGTSVDGLVPH